MWTSAKFTRRTICVWASARILKARTNVLVRRDINWVWMGERVKVMTRCRVLVGENRKNKSIFGQQMSTNVWLCTHVTAKTRSVQIREEVTVVRRSIVRPILWSIPKRESKTLSNIRSSSMNLCFHFFSDKSLQAYLTVLRSTGHRVLPATVVIFIQFHHIGSKFGSTTARSNIFQLEGTALVRKHWFRAEGHPNAAACTKC